MEPQVVIDELRKQFVGTQSVHGEVLGNDIITY
jgi:hypothetical protein